MKGKFKILPNYENEDLIQNFTNYDNFIINVNYIDLIYFEIFINLKNRWNLK